MYLVSINLKFSQETILDENSQSRINQSKYLVHNALPLLYFREERRNGEELGAEKATETEELRPSGGGEREEDRGGEETSPAGKIWEGPRAGLQRPGRGACWGREGGPATRVLNLESRWCGPWPLGCRGSPTAQFIFLVLMTPLPVLLN